MFTRIRTRMAGIIQAAAYALGIGATQYHVTPTSTTTAHAITPTPNNGRVEPRAQRNAPRKRHHSSGPRKPNGIQECARRRRQITAQTLTPSNGLLIMAAERFHANSHGEMQHFY